VRSKRHGQIANDITDAADLASGNRSILRCDEQYLLGIDNVVPV